MALGLAASRNPIYRKEVVMAKGNQKPKKEVKKPKQEKPPKK